MELVEPGYAMVDEGALAVAWQESGTVNRPCQLHDKLAFIERTFEFLSCYATMLYCKCSYECTTEKLANVLVLGLRKCPRLKPFVTDFTPS